MDAGRVEGHESECAAERSGFVVIATSLEVLVAAATFAGRGENRSDPRALEKADQWQKRSIV